MENGADSTEVDQNSGDEDPTTELLWLRFHSHIEATRKAPQETFLGLIPEPLAFTQAESEEIQIMVSVAMGWPIT